MSYSVHSLRDKYSSFLNFGFISKTSRITILPLFATYLSSPTRFYSISKKDSALIYSLVQYAHKTQIIKGTAWLKCPLSSITIITTDTVLVTLPVIAAAPNKEYTPLSKSNY